MLLIKPLPLASLSSAQYCCLSSLDRSQWLKNKLWLWFFTGPYLAPVSHFVLLGVWKYLQTSAWFNKGTMFFSRWFAYMKGILSCCRGVFERSINIHSWSSHRSDEVLETPTNELAFPKLVITLCCDSPEGFEVLYGQSSDHFDAFLVFWWKNFLWCPTFK